MNWLSNRVKERTSWDGAALIAVGGVVLFLGPLATYPAYAYIAFFLWTVCFKEK